MSANQVWPEEHSTIDDLDATGSAAYKVLLDDVILPRTGGLVGADLYSALFIQCAAALQRAGLLATPDVDDGPIIKFGDDVNPEYLMAQLRTGIVVEVATRPNPGAMVTITCVWEGCDGTAAWLTPLNTEEDLDRYASTNERPAVDRWDLPWTQLYELSIA